MKESYSNYRSTPKSSKYTGVIKCVSRVSNSVKWAMVSGRTIKGKQRSVRKDYSTEREAAIAYDKYQISIGKPPVNILVKKLS